MLPVADAIYMTRIQDEHDKSGDKSKAFYDDFAFTIIDSNRAPVIQNDKLPSNSVFSNSALDEIEFYVNVYDGDINPIQIDWYLNGVRTESNLFNFSLLSPLFKNFPIYRLGIR